MQQRARAVILPFALMFAAHFSCVASERHSTTDTGECGEDTPINQSTSKSPIFANKNHTLRAYGRLSFRRVAGNADQSACHVIYELYVEVQGKPFRQVKKLVWDTEDGEIAGIDLIGVSSDGRKLAADFWLAEGDGVEHRPVVYDLSKGQALDSRLGNKIQSRIHSCDQNEDFIGVTNSGEAVFAIPPSIYDDSPACGDKGVWHFNLATGHVYRVAKNSGDKWE